MLTRIDDFLMFFSIVSLLFCITINHSFCFIYQVIKLENAIREEKKGGVIEWEISK